MGGFDPLGFSSESTSSNLWQGSKFMGHLILNAPILTYLPPLVAWTVYETSKDTKNTLLKGKFRAWAAEVTNTALNVTTASFGYIGGLIGGSYLATQFFEPAKKEFDLDKVRKDFELDESSISNLLNGNWINPSEPINSISNGWKHFTDAIEDTSLKDVFDGLHEISGQAGDIAMSGLISETPEGTAAIATATLTPLVTAAVVWGLLRPISRIPLKIHDRRNKLFASFPDRRYG